MLSAAVSTAALGTNSRALWYMTRGFGLIDLVLLTATLVMGLTQVVRYARPGLPRFLIAALHKNISILAVVFLGVHVVTAVADTFAPISIASVLIPFAGVYRPIWLGLGALALDLLVALVVTSLIRERIGQRTWRALHWAAYLCWPVAIVHGLGTGSDTKLGWVLAINALCIGAGIAAIWWRLARGWTSAVVGRRIAALLGTVIAPLVLALWTVAGPLHPGWAKRAGTPVALLRSAPASVNGAGTSTSGGPSPVTTHSARFELPLTANFSGTQSEQRLQGEPLVSVVLSGTFDGGAFQVTLTGEPLDQGVELTGSRVILGPAGDRSLYQGHVTNLNGDTIISILHDRAGRSATMTLQLSNAAGSTIAGTLQVSQ